MQSQTSVLSLLNDYQPKDPEEQKARLFIQDFVQQQTAFWSRETLSGHLTASAWITDRDCRQAVLLHHRKLDMWVQPGGHIDASDPSLIDASRREAIEETGLDGLYPKHRDIFDLDVHAIPARKSEPEHWHLDIRFWWVADDLSLQINEESNDLAWLSAAEIRKRTDEESVLRMVRKTLRES
ncbi:NUDIX hydrolase [Reinekea blandensis]|uniref:(Di)nucleoside polyphosphate hydrolase n=1 Tax=Reinekea blandensis MED297 TaxID=314283 RepID=A4BE75_9GAMM|nr:NUDIX hydrolase [Reinekea blandensis]EAR09553.1 (Di)nucleoside polyphosphate hydrolase [Reinekea blandensis MED297]